MANATNKGKVLIVDDDQALRQLYGIELSNRYYDVVTATNGEEGLEKLKTEKPDLILLDIMMPKMDGVMMLSKVREDAKYKNLPVLMLTNFGQENLVQRAFNAGATDYLLKYKVTPAEMADKVGQILKSTPVNL